MTDTPPRLFADSIHDLSTIFREVWNQLRKAAVDSKHGWNLAVLGTIEGEQARTRLIVIRGVDQPGRTMWCHTDGRSAKIQELIDHPNVSLLSYDREHRVQLSVHATATLHRSDPIADAGWDASRLESLRCYLAPEAPGQLRDEPTVNLPSDLIDRPPTTEEASTGREHFVVVQFEVTSLELLYLAQSGNVRARATWTGSEWTEQWVTP